MKKLLPFLLLGAGVGWLFWNRSKNLAETISAQVLSISLDRSGLSLFSIPFIIKLEISNGSLLGTTFRSLTGDVTVNGKNIARVNLLKNIPIKPTSSTIVELPFTVGTGSLASYLFGIINGGSARNTKINFTGNLVSDAGTIPVQYQSTLG